MQKLARCAYRATFTLLIHKEFSLLSREGEREKGEKEGGEEKEREVDS